MNIHQKEENILPDSDFQPGELCYLVPNNHCRLMDARRTSGKIEQVFPEIGMFRWKILKFEDEGKSWELPIEKICNFQFEKSSQCLSQSEANGLKKIIERFNQPLIIDGRRVNSGLIEESIEKDSKCAVEWLKSTSAFFLNKTKLDLSSSIGPLDLRSD